MAGAKRVERMQADRATQLLPQTHDVFVAGVRLCQAPPDKGYSLRKRARRRRFSAPCDLDILDPVARCEPGEPGVAWAPRGCNP